ncbi:hypothetical protein TELCIR_09672, partial [Teladorsagia circumcincta]
HLAGTVKSDIAEHAHGAWIDPRLEPALTERRLNMSNHSACLNLNDELWEFRGDYTTRSFANGAESIHFVTVILRYCRLLNFCNDHSNNGVQEGVDLWRNIVSNCSFYCEDWSDNESQRKVYGAALLCVQLVVPLTIIIVSYTAISLRIGQTDDVRTYIPGKEKALGAEPSLYRMVLTGQCRPSKQYHPAAK